MFEQKDFKYSVFTFNPYFKRLFIDSGNSLTFDAYLQQVFLHLCSLTDDQPNIEDSP